MINWAFQPQHIFKNQIRVLYYMQLNFDSRVKLAFVQPRQELNIQKLRGDYYLLKSEAQKY